MRPGAGERGGARNSRPCRAHRPRLPPGPFPAIGGSARAGAGARRELPPPAPQQHSVARPAGRGGLKAAATATAAAAAAAEAAAAGGDSGCRLALPSAERDGAPVPGGSAQVVAGGWRGAAADPAVHEGRGAAAGGGSTRAPAPDTFRPPAIAVQPSHLAGVSTAGARLGWAGLGPPAAAARGRPAPWGSLRQGRGAGPQRPSGAAGLGPGGGPRRRGGVGRGRAAGCTGGRGAAALRGVRGRGGPLLLGSAALGCALITGQMSEQLRGVLLTAWLFEHCHCSASL